MKTAATRSRVRGNRQHFGVEISLSLGQFCQICQICQKSSNLEQQMKNLDSRETVLPRR